MRAAARRLDLDCGRAGPVRRAGIEQLARHFNRLAGQVGKLGAHLDERLRAESLVIKRPNSIQNSLFLRGGLRLGLRPLPGEDVAALFEFAAERYLLLGEDVMLALLVECARAQFFTKVADNRIWHKSGLDRKS